MTTRKRVAASAAASNNHASIIIVFGTTERHMPQAGRYVGEQIEGARLTAALLGLNVLEVRTDAQAELAARLRPGNLLGSSRSFAPLIGLDLHAALLAETQHAVSETFHQREPVATWGDLTLGHIVIAPDREEGEPNWSEAVVVQTTNEHLALRWLHTPRLPAFVRPRSGVALLGREPHADWPTAPAGAAESVPTDAEAQA